MRLSFKVLSMTINASYLPLCNFVNLCALTPNDLFNSMVIVPILTRPLCTPAASIVWVVERNHGDY